MTLNQFWKNYNLSIVLLILFVITWALQTWTGWVAFQNDQTEHGQVAQFFGHSGYVWDWTQATMENWQSEFLQLLTFVILTSFLIHVGSHESKDEDERVQEQLNRIEQKLDMHIQERR